MAISQRKEILPAVFLTCVEGRKFKTGCLSLSMLAELDLKTAPQNALLPRVLCRGSARYPDMEKLAVRMEELYGASMSGFVRKKGEIQAFGLYFQFLDNAFVPDGADLLGQMTELAGELLLDPALENGCLRRDYVGSERDNLIDRIRAQVNDKRSFAAIRLAETMCAGERYGITSSGRISEAEKITAESLTAHYRHVLESSRIEIFYSGSASAEQVEKLLLEALKKLPRKNPQRVLETRVLTAPPRAQVQYVTESMDVTQGKLSVGFRLGWDTGDYGAVQVFNALYGGCLTSKLFTNVRERLSLCYYASSGVERHKGLLTVQSGIESANYWKALDEILRQLEACKQGEISQAELDDAKSAMLTALHTLQDDQWQMEDFYLGQALKGMQASPEELAERCRQVTRENVQRVAQSVRLDTVYFLKDRGEGAQGNAE